MKKLAVLFLAALLSFVAISVNAGLSNAVYWDFGPSVPSSTATSNSFSGLTVSALSQSNSFGGYSGTTGNSPFNGSSASTAYTTSAGFGNSAGTNAGIAVFAGSLNTTTSAFYQVSISLDSLAPDSYTFTNFSFGERSTATGAQLFSLYSSADNSSYSFVSSVALANNSTWAAKDFGALSLELDPGNSLFLRIFASNDTGAPGAGTVTTRIDDLALGFTTIPVPEPSSLTLAAMGGAAFLVAFRRRR